MARFLPRAADQSRRRARPHPSLHQSRLEFPPKECQNYVQLNAQLMFSLQPAALGRGFMSDVVMRCNFNLFLPQ